MINFWKLSYEEVKKQRDQYKQENEELKESFRYQLEKRLEYFKKCQELKKKNEEYRKEIEKLNIENEYLLNIIKMSDNIEVHSDAYDEMEKGESNKTYHIPHITNINIKDNTEEPMKFIKRIAKERADDER